MIIFQFDIYLLLIVLYVKIHEIIFDSRCTVLELRVRQTESRKKFFKCYGICYAVGCTV